MARQRMIKPDFWADEKLIECSLSARLLFIGCLNFADDYGHLQRSAKKLKMQVFPADDVNCEELLNELLTHGLLMEYSVNNEKFLNIKGFRKHQVINRPSNSTIPNPDGSMNTHTTLTECSLPTHTEKKRREEKRKEKYIASDHLVSAGADKNLVSDWFLVRQKKKSTNTETAMLSFLSEVEKSKLNINDVLRMCVEKSWAGFKASWNIDDFGQLQSTSLFDLPGVPK